MAWSSLTSNKQEAFIRYPAIISDDHQAKINYSERRHITRAVCCNLSVPSCHTGSSLWRLSVWRRRGTRQLTTRKALREGPWIRLEQKPWYPNYGVDTSVSHVYLGDMAVSEADPRCTQSSRCDKCLGKCRESHP